MANDTVSKIFFPETCLSAPSGFIIGWNLRGFIACVATIVPETRLDDLEEIMESYQKDVSLTALRALSTGEPCVLGEWHAGDRTATSFLHSRSDIKSLRQQTSIWFTLVKDQQTASPTVKEVICCGIRYLCSVSQFIYYRPPQRGHYFAVDPLKLDIAEQQANQNNNSFSTLPIPPSSASKTSLASAKQPRLRSGSSASASSSSAASSSASNDAERSETELILEQINSSYHVADYVFSKRNELEAARSAVRSPAAASASSASSSIPIPTISSLQSQANVDGGGPRPRNFVGGGGIRGSSWFNSFIVKGLWSPFAFIVTAFLFLLRLCVDGTLRLLHYSPSWAYGYCLSNVLDIGQQLELRMIELRSLPSDFLFMRRRFKNSPQARAAYLNFYSSFSRLAVDMALGVICGFVIIVNIDPILRFLEHTFDVLCVNFVRDNVVWFMGWPAGFKLNEDLDRTLGRISLFGINQWTAVIDLIKPIAHVLVMAVAAIGVLGASHSLALLSDLLSLLTVHIHVFYLLSAVLYKHMLQAISSLWKLFRGLKRNVLRRRIDSCEYSVDQLLLGTLFFTLLAFLFPTVCVYYTFFAAARLLIVALKAVMAALRAILNHFPIFSFSLYLIDPLRFPGGVHLDMITPHANSEPSQGPLRGFFSLLLALIRHPAKTSAAILDQLMSPKQQAAVAASASAASGPSSMINASSSSIPNTPSGNESIMASSSNVTGSGMVKARSMNSLTASASSASSAPSRPTSLLIPSANSPIFSPISPAGVVSLNNDTTPVQTVPLDAASSASLLFGGENNGSLSLGTVPTRHKKVATFDLDNQPPVQQPGSRPAGGGLRRNPNSFSLSSPMSAGPSIGSLSFGSGSSSSLSSTPSSSFSVGIRSAYKTQLFFKLRSQSIPFGSIFYQYKQIVSSLLGFYSPGKILKCVFFGDPVPAAPALQFTKPRENLPSLIDFWLFCKAYFHPIQE